MRSEPVTAAQGGFLGHKGKLWRVIASWFVPLVMSIAYATFAWLSGASHTGWAWLSIGLAFVLTLWWLIRMLMRNAAIARAMAVGDAEMLLEADRRPIAAALAHDLNAAWIKSLAVLDRLPPSPKLQLRVLASTLRIGALVETGEVAKARVELEAIQPVVAQLHPRLESPSHLAVLLAQGKVLTAERSNAEALVVLQKVIDDVRTGQRTRGLAHHYAARAAAADGQHELADKHRERAAALAPNAWFAA
jgi:tetratricopeptide (TPR) repeat protein